MADLSAGKLAVIGCGNPNRTDDGVGPAVIARLRDRALPKCVALFDAGTDGMAVLYRLRGAARVAIIDARAPERQPGAVYDVPAELLAREPARGFTLHDFRWEHALFAGRRIHGSDFLLGARVFLIEAESLAFGIGLTPSVDRAADHVARTIEDLAATFAAGRASLAAANEVCNVKSH